MKWCYVMLRYITIKGRPAVRIGREFVMRFARVIIACVFSLAALAQSPTFDYARTRPFDIRIARTEMRQGIRIDDLSFANLTGTRTEAYIVHSATKGKAAGALFVHWYESE